MKIKQDPVTGLWCREDGAVLMPPDGYRFKSFRWTFGSNDRYGYKTIGFHGKYHKVHQIICRAFNGLPPTDKPFVDHIDRCKTNNMPSNLRWASSKENNDNKDRVDKSIERYGVRACDDRKSYQRAYDATKAAKMKAQGLHYCKGPNGKYGWHPRIRARAAI